MITDLEWARTFCNNDNVNFMSFVWQTIFERFVYRPEFVSLIRYSISLLVSLWRARVHILNFFFKKKTYYYYKESSLSDEADYSTLSCSVLVGFFMSYLMYSPISLIFRCICCATSCCLARKLLPLSRLTKWFDLFSLNLLLFICLFKRIPLFASALWSPVSFFYLTMSSLSSYFFKKPSFNQFLTSKKNPLNF